MKWRDGIGVAAACGILLVGLWGNVRQLGQRPILDQGDEHGIVALAESPLLKDAPASMQPLPLIAPEMTAGWLREAERQGKIPRIALTAQDRANATVALSFDQVTHRRARCGPPSKVVKVRRGDVVDIPEGATTVLISSRGGSAFYVAGARVNGFTVGRGLDSLEVVHGGQFIASHPVRVCRR